MKKSSTIEIDLDLYKLIEAERQSFDESENDILRRLLNLEQKQTPIVKHSGSQGVDIGSGVFLPDGTILKKRFKGNLYEFKVENGKIWVNGKGYTSASGAAVAVTGSSVNGWIFWKVKRPDDIDFRLLDDLRKR
jgi:hypothetical protein